jgi:UDP-N-acetylglucosamine transferase subunit ALG13
VIFASVGSMFPFDRLVEAVDLWAARSGEEVLVQIGDGTYQPRHAKWVRMLPPDQFQATLSRSRIFVAHLGMGSLMSGLQAGVPTVLMPRLRALGEHNTDHQLSGARWIRGRPGIWVADDAEHLRRILEELATRRENEKPQGIPAYSSPELIARVRSFIDS